jgi:RNA polymerase sigma factor (sigma-70 family)
MRFVDVFVHRRRLSPRALLLEKPAPRWIETRLEALHAEGGCQRNPATGSKVPALELAKALAQLPWSGEWLVLVWSTLSGEAASSLRPAAEAWLAARNSLVEDHRGLVTTIARRYVGRSGLSRDDLIQEGLLALCRAVERYEPNRGTRFSSYAVSVLQRVMAHAVRKMGNPPAAPMRLFDARTSAGPLRIRSSAVTERIRSRPPALVSLDAAAERSDDSGTLAERITDPNLLRPDVSAMRSIELERLRVALRALPSDVQQILALHWGLEDGIARSVHQISRFLDRHVEGIQAIIAESRRLLRRRLEGARPGPSGCAHISGAGQRVPF